LRWNKTFKEQIRRRDEYRCCKCGIPEVELIRRLTIHHKDLNKQNIDPSNLISMYLSCHIRLHWEIRKKIDEQNREVINGN